MSCNVDSLWPLESFNEEHFDTSQPPNAIKPDPPAKRQKLDPGTDPSTPIVRSKSEAEPGTTNLCLIYLVGNSQPIRLARIMLETTEDNPSLTVHWHGSRDDLDVEDLAKKLIFPMWFMPNLINPKLYYLSGRQHSSHVQYDNRLTKEPVHQSDIICANLTMKKKTKQNSGEKLTADSVRRCIIAIDQVIQALPENVDPAHFKSF